MMQELDDFLLFRSPGYTASSMPRSSTRTTVGPTSLFGADDDFTVPHARRTVPRDTSPDPLFPAESLAFTPPPKSRTPPPSRTQPPSSPAEEIDTECFQRPHVAEPTATPMVHRYFTLLRSPQPAAGKNQQRHPQEHIIQRKFRVTVDNAGHGRITRQLEGSLEAPQFNCEEQISDVLNMQDAALSRLVASRAAFASEMEAYRCLCEATSTVAEKIGNTLSPLPKPISLEETLKKMGEDGDESQRLSGADDDEALWEVGKTLTKVSDGRAQEAINDLLQRTVECSKADCQRVATLLDELRDEVLCGSSSAGHPASLHIAAITAGLNELEQKTNEPTTNTLQATEARRIQFSKMSRAVKEAVNAVRNHDEPDHEALKARQAATDSSIAKSVSEAHREVDELDEQMNNLKRLREVRQTEAQRLQAAISMRHKGLQQTLRDSDQQIQHTVIDIETSYAKLEAQLHRRANLVKEFVQDIAASQNTKESIAAATEEAEQQLGEVKSKRAARVRTLDVVERIKDVAAAVRASTERNLSQQQASYCHSNAKQQLRRECEIMCRNFRWQTARWIDFLSRSFSREVERISHLHFMVQDADERHKDEEKELYSSQLAEASSRRDSLHAEMGAAEQLLLQVDAFIAEFSNSDVKPPSAVIAASVDPTLERALSISMDASSAGFTVVDVDAIPVAELVALFRKPPTTTSKWIETLKGCDIDTVKDLRDIRSVSSIWEGFLCATPLLKSQVELFLDEPERYLE